ncbi:MAG: hypothetical protein CBC74_000130 [Crocinitomicaceae bacterium TMED114]|nr:MAG: hypothetical protein CBC74_000130 [Crocinitomicaceae bacterium TMED114]
MVSPASAGTACSNRSADLLSGPLLPLRPFPPVHWWCAGAADGAQLDVGEHYPKRTFRNRMVLATANGLENLTLPVERRGGLPRSQFETRRVLADADKLWRAVHTAYGAAPFFEEMAPELEVLFRHGPDTIGEWNLSSIRWAADWLGAEVPAQASADDVDRKAIQHEAQDVVWAVRMADRMHPWHHVWADRATLSWESLSVMDLLLHCGPAAAEWIIPFPSSGSRRPE